MFLTTTRRPPIKVLGLSFLLLGDRDLDLDLLAGDLERERGVLDKNEAQNSRDLSNSIYVTISENYVIITSGRTKSS